MGRDDSDAAMYKLFWSWDSTSLWTGTGQTGDACALFDSDGDGNVNFAVCARIENPNADPTQAKLTADSPFLFSCDDSKNDRCAPADSARRHRRSRPGRSDREGRIATGNLITDTDPFAPAGSDSPNDVTLQVNIPKILLNGGVLVNVCSYPSAGNGGNNNPFDCIANPGGGFLVIVKNAGNDTTTSFPFAVSPVPNGTAANYTIVGSGETDPISLIVGTNTETVTETVPAGWKLSTASCTLSGNATGTFDSCQQPRHRHLDRLGPRDEVHLRRRQGQPRPDLGQDGVAADLLRGGSDDLVQLSGHQQRQRVARRPGHGHRRQGDGHLPSCEHRGQQQRHSGSG